MAAWIQCDEDKAFFVCGKCNGAGFLNDGREKFACPQCKGQGRLEDQEIDAMEAAEEAAAANNV